MLIAIIGENCVGKSTLANKINQKLNAKIFSGKDYLRLEKNPAMAEKSFKELLSGAVLSFWGSFSALSYYEELVNDYFNYNLQ